MTVMEWLRTAGLVPPRSESPYEKEMGDAVPVGSFTSPKTGQTIRVMAKRGEKPQSAMARVRAKHNT